MLDSIKSFLLGLGLSLAESDDSLLEMFINEIINLIELETNRKYDPKADYILQNLVASKFLKYKRLVDKESLTNLNLTDVGSVSSITVGDTSTAFNSNAKSDEEVLDEFIAYLESSKKQLVKLRRIQW